MCLAYGNEVWTAAVRTGTFFELKATNGRSRCKWRRGKNVKRCRVGMEGQEVGAQYCGVLGLPMRADSQLWKFNLV